MVGQIRRARLQHVVPLEEAHGMPGLSREERREPRLFLLGDGIGKNDDAIGRLRPRMPQERPNGHLEHGGHAAVVGGEKDGTLGHGMLLSDSCVAWSSAAANRTKRFAKADGV